MGGRWSLCLTGMGQMSEGDGSRTEGIADETDSGGGG